MTHSASDGLSQHLAPSRGLFADFDEADRRESSAAKWPRNLDVAVQPPGWRRGVRAPRSSTQPVAYVRWLEQVTLNPSRAQRCASNPRLVALQRVPPSGTRAIIMCYPAVRCPYEG